jgi:hypothetical protein
MYIQILAISSLVLSLASIIFSYMLFIKVEKVFKRQKAKFLDLDQQNNNQQQKLEILSTNLSERNLTSEVTVPIVTDVVRREMNSYRLAVDLLKSQIEEHTRSISTLRQSIEDLSIKREKPPHYLDLPGLIDTTPQQQAMQPLPQSVFSSLFPTLGSPAAVSECVAEIGAGGSLAPPEPAMIIEPYEAATQHYQDAVNRIDRQALRKMQYRELNISGDSEDALARGNSLMATRLVAVNGGGSYMIVNSEGRFWLFPTALTLDSFSGAQPQKGIFSYETGLLTRPSVKKPAEVKEEGDSWVVTALGVIYLSS